MIEIILIWIGIIAQRISLALEKIDQHILKSINVYNSRHIVSASLFDSIVCP